MWTSSIRDIRFLQNYFNFCGFLGISPWYNFEQNVISHPKLSKIFAIFLSLSTIYFSYLTTTSMRAMKSKVSALEYALMISLNTFLAFVTLSKFYNANFRTDLWVKLFKNFRYIDEKLLNRGRSQKVFYRNFYFTVLVNVVAFAILGAFFAYSWKEFFMYDTAFTAASTVQTILVILEGVLLQALLNSFQVRYKDLNAIVLKKFGQKHFPKFQIDKCFRVLCESVEIFNRLFGFSFLLYYAHMALEIILLLDFSVLSLSFSGFMNAPVWSTLLTIFVILVSTLAIVLPCDATVEEAKRIIKICRQLEERYEERSQEREELKRLADYAKDFIPKFTGGGFFVVDKGSVFGLIGTITTYFIVIIQFKR